MKEKTTKNSVSPVARFLKYAVIERALGGVFAVDGAGQRAWLRARIQHLRRLGLIPDSPGKGRVIRYTQSDADKWLVALELAHMGADPKMVVDLIERTWDPPHRKRSAAEAVARGEAFIRDLVDEARASRRPDEDVFMTVRFIGGMSEEPHVGYTTLNGMESFGYWLTGAGTNPRPRRASIFNFSERLRRFDAALATAKDPAPQPKLTGLAKDIVNAARRRRGEPEL
jgi:hypothetical protein